MVIGNRAPWSARIERFGQGMTVSLDEQEDIRQMDRDGMPRARIAREPNLSRNTVSKHAGKQDMSPAAPVSKRRAHPAADGLASWIDATLASDQAVPRKQRHTAQRIFDRAVDEKGYAGSYSSIRRHVATWKREHVQGPEEGFLELQRAPGTAQVDFGNFEAQVAGQSLALKLLVVSFPHSNARFCVALPSEKAGVFCRGLRHVFEWVGRAPRTLALDNATETGRMVFGKVTESKPFSQFRAHYRCESRYCNPYSGNEKGPVENAVGFLRRDLLAPVPQATSLDELNEALRKGCDKIGVQAKNGAGVATQEAFVEDLASMLALPGAVFDAVRWVKAKSDKRGYVRIDDNLYCAGPVWHDRELVVGVRAKTVEILADRGRHVATLGRSFKEGERVRNPVSLVPAPIARPRAFGESTIRADMPDGPVDAIDQLDKAGRRQALRVLARTAETSGFKAACEAEEHILEGGRIPDEASADILARRIAAGRLEGEAGQTSPPTTASLRGGRPGWPRQMPWRKGLSPPAGGARPPGQRLKGGPARARLARSSTSRATSRRSARAGTPPGARTSWEGVRLPSPRPSTATDGTRQAGPGGSTGTTSSPSPFWATTRTWCLWGASVLAGPIWQRPCAPFAARTPVPPVSSPRRLW